MTRLATLKGCKLKVLDSILELKGDFGQDVAGLRETSATPGRLRSTEQTGLEGLEGLEGQEVAERVKLVGSAKVFKWPTRLGKMLHLAGPDLALREAAEKAERDRWLAMLRDIMKKASLPATRRSKRTR